MTKRRKVAAVPKVEKVASKAAAEPRYRTVRPRPLRYDEKVRILWPGDPELEEIDGGAFAQFLRDTQQNADFEDLIAQAAKPSKRRVSAKHKVGPSDRRPSSAASSGSSGGTPAPCIEVPRFRLLPEGEWPGQPPAPPAHKQGGEAAYIRLRGQTQDELDSKVDYDLDSDDEGWLDHRNKKGLGEQLSKDDLERLIDGFEKSKHAVLEVKQTEWKRNHKAQGKTDPAVLYPASAAIKDFADVFPSLTVRAVHNYWAKKAAASKLPLLQRFWYDKPWARLVALTGRQEETSSSDDDGALPFQGKDSPKAAHHRKRQMELEEIHDRLHIARIDLERLRTIADQVQRREKIKKRDLLEWRTLWRQKLAVVGTPKVMKKVGRPASAKAAKAGAAKGKAKAEKVSAPKGRPAKAGGVAGKGGSIVGGVLSQIRKGQKGRPRAKKEAPPAAPKKEDDEAKEQELIEAAIQVSLAKGDGAAAAKPASRPGSASKRVKFLDLNGDMKNRSRGAAKADPSAGKAAGRESKKPAVAGAQEGPSHSSRRAGAVPAAEEAQMAAKHEPAAEDPEGAGDESDDLPPGFTLQAGGPGRRKGSIEWVAECQHGSQRLHNVTGLVDFFGQHSKCRSEWKQFSRRKRESAADYATRVTAAFPLTKAAAAGRGWHTTALPSRPPPAKKSCGSAAAPRSAGNRELAALVGTDPLPALGGKSRARKSLATQVEHPAREVATKRRSQAEPASKPDEKPPAKRATRGLSSSREQSAVTEGASGSGRRTTRGRDADKAVHALGARDTAWRSLGRTEAGDPAGPSEERSEGSEEASSGSDTFIPADSEPESSSGTGRAFQGRRSQARPSRSSKQGVIPKPRKPPVWDNWRGQAQDDASDESCISEDPSLFSEPEPPKSTVSRRLPPRPAARGTARGTAKNIVAAARQRVKKLGKKT